MSVNLFVPIKLGASGSISKKLIMNKDVHRRRQVVKRAKNQKLEVGVIGLLDGKVQIV